MSTHLSTAPYQPRKKQNIARAVEPLKPVWPVTKTRLPFQNDGLITKPSTELYLHPTIPQVDFYHVAYPSVAKTLYA